MKRTIKMGKGWYREPRRHSLARMGIKTTTKNEQKIRDAEIKKYEQIMMLDNEGRKIFSKMNNKEKAIMLDSYKAKIGKDIINDKDARDFYRYVQKINDLAKQQESQEAKEMAIAFEATENPKQKETTTIKEKGWEKELDNFTGTENYYSGYLGVKETDGVHYLGYNASWLVSDIESVVKAEPRTKKEEFVVIKIEAKNNRVVVKYENGNNKNLYTQKYEYSDLPDGKYKLYYTNGVLMLSSEY